MKLNWQIRTLKEWRDLYSRTTRQNWMQTWAYAQASLRSDYLNSKLGVVEKEGKIVAVLCVQEIKLGPFHIVNLKRGPLWFLQPSKELFVEFAQAFRNEFPKSTFQRLRWMPEFEMQQDDEKSVLENLSKIGFHARKENFVTSWVDLRQSADEIRKNLDQKWRNCLNKSEKLNPQVVVESKLSNSNVFFELYNQHLKIKKYHGPSEKFLRTEFLELEKTGDIFYLWCFWQNTPVAGLVVTIHGNTATYRVGWNTDAGRKCNAHYLLIWKAIQLVKENGSKYFDVGGLKPDESSGFTDFKFGLRGKTEKFFIFGN